MSPATLYREGTDLDDLLADLDQQYPGRVRVVEIARPREGGVLGFFAKQRVGVHYRLTGAESPGIATPPIYDASSAGTPDRSDDAPFAQVLAGATREAGSSTAETTAELPVRELPIDDTVEFTSPPSSRVAPAPLRVSKVYAEIQARAEAAAARIAADLTATPGSGFVPAVPDAVPAPRPACAPASRTATGPAPRTGTQPAAPPTAAPQGSSVQSLIQWPTTGRRKPRAVPQFQPLPATPAADRGSSAPEPSAAPPDTAVRPALTDLPAVPRAGRLAWPLAESAAATAPPAAAGTVIGVEPGAAARPTSDAAHVLTASAPEQASYLPTPTPLTRRLAALGVAEHRIPAEIDQTFTAVQQIVEALPAAPAPPTGSGEVLVLAGRAQEAMLAADALVAGSAGLIREVWRFGCAPASRIAGQDDHTLSSAEHATETVASLRASAAGPILVVVATDGPGWTNRAAEVVEAIGADTLWAVVDATVKPEDTAASLRQWGEVDALVVAAAEHSSSPATVWDLDLPIALVDGRPASPSAWAVLLMGKLMDRTCSDPRR